MGFLRFILFHRKRFCMGDSRLLLTAHIDGLNPPDKRGIFMDAADGREVARPGNIHQGLLGEITHASTLLFTIVLNRLQQGLVVLRQIIEHAVTVVGLQVMGKIPEIAFDAVIPPHVLEKLLKLGVRCQNLYMVVYLGDALEFTDANAEHILISITCPTGNFNLCAITGTDGNSSVH